MKLGTLIKIYRKKNNLTQSDFAKKCNISRQTVTRLELANEEDSVVNEKTLSRIAFAMDMTYPQLVSSLYNNTLKYGTIHLEKEQMIVIYDNNCREVNSMYLSDHRDCIGFYPHFPNISKIFLVQKKSTDIESGNLVAVKCKGKIVAARMFKFDNGNCYSTLETNTEIKGPSVSVIGKIIGEISLYNN